MQQQLRYLALAAALGAAVAITVFLLGATLSPFPVPLLALALLLCPAHVLFIATAACDPFDACSSITLIWSISFNAALYAAVASCLWFAKARLPKARSFLLFVIAIAAVLFLRLWL